MFNQKQLNNLDRVYFFVYEATPVTIVLKSKNTRHFWKVNTEGNKIVLYHSHMGNGNYHIQRVVKNLKSAINLVKRHDAFQIKHRKPEDNDRDYIPLPPDSEFFIF